MLVACGCHNVVRAINTQFNRSHRHRLSVVALNVIKGGAVGRSQHAYVNRLEVAAGRVVERVLQLVAFALGRNTLGGRALAALFACFARGAAITAALEGAIALSIASVAFARRVEAFVAVLYRQIWIFALEAFCP
eukprot:CAMPEP_0119185586 /NCGR_PEP_ID=MMETSP1315-20130426/68588_1 /TAXON_ID=676789 /ORGANISM="Prasinoderma singularis, Strain RCC927" /LENGTH=134 /DNA_ID=CAMNT_0007180019 /DNA_START=950 /DNA_END=1354 /DNA_ORIENTATION=+